MRWWCSASDLPWTWQWQAYPGVWLFVLAIGSLYAWAVWRLEPSRLARDDRPTAPRDVILFLLGLLALWIATDWPLGALAAGYLLSAKTLQYLLLAYVAPGLMLLGTPRWLLRRLVRSRSAFGLAKVLSRPLLPLAITNGVLVAAHLPVVVDGVSGSQFGSFLVDLIVLGSGFVFWWPALGLLPELDPLSYGARIGYLGLNVFVPTVPASFFTFSQYPIYALYELAPRVAGIGAIDDQRAAGMLMKLAGGALLFGTMSVMFFRWYRQEAAADPDAAVQLPR